MKLFIQTKCGNSWCKKKLRIPNTDRMALGYCEDCFEIMNKQAKKMFNTK